MNDEANVCLIVHRLWFLVLSHRFWDFAMSIPFIPMSEYAARREAVLKSLDGAAAVVFAGDSVSPLHGRFRPDPNFIYLTGIEDEPGAAVLFDPTNEDPKKRIALLLKPLNIEVERWDGYREEIGSKLKEKTGFKTIFRIGALNGMLTGAVKRAKKGACLAPFATYPAPVSADLAALQQIQQRVLGVSIIDRTTLLPNMRAIKSKTELALIQKACDITEEAYLQAIKHIRPGLNESRVQLALETVYREAGGGLAYNSIVGSGMNGTVLHYNANNNELKAGDLLVIDSAASYGGYCSDITRTFPVSGKFTKEQKDIYNVVLQAELAAIKASKPGMKMFDVDNVAREVITKAGYGDYFIHSIGHPLGLVVHDVVPDHPLKANMVITIEPGIYIPELKMGIRIEDDVLITPKGPKVITPNVPKTVEDIEAAMKRG